MLRERRSIKSYRFKLRLYLCLVLWYSFGIAVFGVGRNIHHLARLLLERRPALLVAD